MKATFKSNKPVIPVYWYDLSVGTVFSFDCYLRDNNPPKFMVVQVKSQQGFCRNKGWMSLTGDSQHGNELLEVQNHSSGCPVTVLGIMNFSDD